MATKIVNKLPHNLPQLQNLIKRDPGSYKEEVSINKHQLNVTCKTKYEIYYVLFYISKYLCEQ